MGFFLFVILVKHTYLYSTISLETLALLFTVNIKHFIQSFSSLEQLFNSFVFSQSKSSSLLPPVFDVKQL